jgi:hypothetical protein
MAREYLREAILAAGCTSQLVFLFACPIPGVVALVLPLVVLGVALASGTQSRPAVRVLAATLYLVTMVYCALQSAAGIHPEGWGVFLAVMLPGAAILLREAARVLTSRRERGARLP